MHNANHRRQILYNEEVLQNFNDHDFLTSFPDEFRPTLSTTLNQPFIASHHISAGRLLRSHTTTPDDDIQNLIKRYECFLNDHKDIVRRSRKSFIDRIMNHFLQQLLGSSFNSNDIKETCHSIQKYCIENEADLGTMFDYFYDDVRTVLLNRNWLPTWVDCLLNGYTKPIMRTFFIHYVQSRGAQTLTTKLYPNVDRNSYSQLSSSIQPNTLRKKLFLISLILVFINWVLIYFFNKSFLLLTIAIMIVVVLLMVISR
ncbi:unnamed protein product [Adineta steineri]|uniref:Uncharacterized protein n=1 Tax=Adineta steineri TaxID=433720 RepID=A0A818MKT9_9BILA|nr:unnamed protein product [Adineta steineri]